MPYQPLLSVKNLTVNYPGQKNILDGISFILNKGESLGIDGDVGSGKTTLAKALLRKQYFRGNIDFNGNQSDIFFVAQWDTFKNFFGFNDYYYQQRYNSQEAEDAPTVAQTIDKIIAEESSSESRESILSLLKLNHLASAHLIQLSNGEHKRLQLSKVFLKKPKLLIADRPFAGLDVASVEVLTNLFHQLQKNGTALIIFGDKEHWNGLVQQCFILGEGKLHPETDWKNHYKPPVFIIPDELLKISTDQFTSFENAVKMENVNLSYGTHFRLNNFNWTVKKGERWQLKGPNGSGKSTLLSLITADNPQAYAQNFYLFDRKRGTGESIWDIKKRIGFVSPEMQRYFDKNINVFNTVASGLHDTMGLYKKLKGDELERVNRWMNFLQIGKQKNSLLGNLSSGQQLLVLTARALVKNPDLIILDEPCQFLDEAQSSGFIQLIDQLIPKTGKTLIYVSHEAEKTPACVTKEFVLDGLTGHAISKHYQKELA